MLNKGMRLLPVCALALILVAAAVPEALSAVSTGDKAPSFTLPNVTGKGDVTLPSKPGKPTLLVFWASWCSHCQREISVIESLYKDLAPKGVKAVGVSVDKDRNDAGGFVKEHKLTFSNAFAGTERGKKVIKAYGLKSIPAIYVLDKNGVIKARYIGQVDPDLLRKKFAEMGVK